MSVHPQREIFCNRTTNLRGLRAIGYDMDYTLVHYREAEWEMRAYQHLKQAFLNQGWPIEHLEFDPAMVCRGLIVDTEQGNLVKANRFGFIKHAMHGTRALAFEAQRDTYSRTIVDLADKRWYFLNTLFSLSEGCMYAQLVELLDARKAPEVLGYTELFQRVRDALDSTHMEGRLKAEIITHPEKYVVLDPDIVLALLDQKKSGKKLMLITNSEWSYTKAMMTYAFDRFLPAGMRWRELFDITVVGARKPLFFMTESPIFEVADPDTGLLRPHSGALSSEHAYLGGSARQIERHLGLSGDEILYVGDHMFGDVHVTKNVLRWRTALVLRELEAEIEAVNAFRPVELKLHALMAQKESVEDRLCAMRLDLQRLRESYGPQPEATEAEILARITRLRAEIDALDQQIGPLARLSSELSNPNWGLLMRAGNDKSYLAFQMERYADIYTSRVSNFLFKSPFAYLRSQRGSLPHDTPAFAEAVARETV